VLRNAREVLGRELLHDRAVPRAGIEGPERQLPSLPSDEDHADGSPPHAKRETRLEIRPGPRGQVAILYGADRPAGGYPKHGPDALEGKRALEGELLGDVFAFDVDVVPDDASVDEPHAVAVIALTNERLASLKPHTTPAVDELVEFLWGRTDRQEGGTKLRLGRLAGHRLLSFRGASSARLDKIVPFLT
jgi:hypothetical protein